MVPVKKVVRTFKERLRERRGTGLLLVATLSRTSHLLPLAGGDERWRLGGHVLPNVLHQFHGIAAQPPLAKDHRRREPNGESLAGRAPFQPDGPNRGEQSNSP
jgi:hypothetical protein